MQTESVLIDGVAGPVTVEVNGFSGKGRVSVGGIPQHNRRGIVELPAVGGGSVRAKLGRSNFFDPYPTIEVNGVKHRTGPNVPYPLRFLVLLPFALVFFGGLLGGIIGALGVVTNQAVARRDRSPAAKTLLMLLVLVCSALAYLVVAGVVMAAVDA